MKCAIQLVFSHKDQTIINQIRKSLIDNGVHDEAEPINHITLTTIEVQKNQIALLEAILEKFAQTHKSLNLVLSSVGSFMSKENVIFLNPTMTEDLMQYNAEIVDILSQNNFNCRKFYYTKNNWQPHCTISIRLTDNEFFTAMKTLKENNLLPINVVADSIDLVCYDPKPYDELIKFDFQ